MGACNVRPPLLVVTKDQRLQFLATIALSRCVVIWDHQVTDHQATNHQATDHQATNHQATNHQATDHQATDHQPSQSSISTVQVVLKCLSHTPGSHSVCAVRTQLGVEQTLEFPPPGKNPVVVVSHAGQTLSPCESLACETTVVVSPSLCCFVTNQIRMWYVQLRALWCCG